MIDPVQLVLLIVVVLLAIIMVVLGIQVFFILKDLRTTLSGVNKLIGDSDDVTDAFTILKETHETLQRVNRLLDTADEATDAIAQPLSLLSGIISSTKTISSILGLGKNNDR